MRVGIIGCGHIAGIHVQAIRAVEDAEIVGVADAFGDYARAFARRFGIPHTSDTVGRLIEETKPDVVHVLTPPPTHCSVALECLQRSCHVLVEKPMALDGIEADQMIRAAKSNGVLLSVNHNFRFEPVVRRAAELLASGRLGDLVTLEVDCGYNINRYQAMVQPGAEKSHWAYRLNGGPLQDQMPHPASLVLEHLREVKDLVILSKNRGILPGPWPDEIRVCVDAEESHAEVYISFSLKPDAMVLTIRGTKGNVVADLGSMIVTVETNHFLPRAVERGRAGFTRGLQNLKGAVGNVFRVATGKFDTTGGTKCVVAKFYEAIKQGKEPPVTAEEGKRVVELIQRIWPEPVGPVLGKQSAQTLPAGSAHIKTRQHPTTLVTGASGFIGSHLVKRLLSESVSIRALVRPNSYGFGLLKDMDVEIAYGDLSNVEAVENALHGIDTVFHLGAAMSGDWETHHQSTVVGTQNVIDAAIKTNGKRVIHLSSLVVYRMIGVSKGTVIDETWPYEEQVEKLGPYSRAKIEAEKIVLGAHTERGLPACVIRPGIVIGPRGAVFFPHLGYRIQDKVFIVLGRGEGILPLIYIDNLVGALIRCANDDVAVGKTYNLVDDGSVTVIDYLSSFINHTKLPSRLIKVPYIFPYCATGLYEIAAMCGALKKGATSRRQLSWKHKCLQLKISNDRAKKDLGWSSTVPIDEALARTFQWYAERL